MNKHMQMALELATYSTAKVHKMGCVVTDRKGNMISTGINKPSKSHPVQADYACRIGEAKKIYLHAELDALIKCKEKPYSIYVARINRSGHPAMSFPCPICSLAIKELGIKKVHYINEKGIEISWCI